MKVAGLRKHSAIFFAKKIPFPAKQTRLFNNENAHFDFSKPLLISRLMYSFTLIP